MADNTTAQASTSLSFFSDSFIIKRGKKPLRSLEFILDLEDENSRLQLEKDIKLLGGKILESLDDDGKKPFCIVTDHPHARYLEKVTKTKKVTPEHCSALPVLLRVAVQNDVRVRTYTSFLQILSNVKNRIKLNQNAKLAPVKPKLEKQKSMRKLTPPFIKFEDNSLQYAPSWKEYGIPSNFRPIYVGEAAGRSIFHKASPEFLKRKKETKISKPRAKSRVGPGFCDICTRDCQDLQLHFLCKEHQTRINTPGFYDEVDALCGSFVKEIVVPNKRLRKRLTPEPLSLPSSHFADSTLPLFRTSGSSVGI
ncbi:hypothetical protein X798_01309 [Onchocerca flexuosa]|uniref:DBF4-type domain-containing protein n=1 Tax=Onchocerca flexuosa TaxID=387005 RepID=A0A238C1U0_9BILA|nr:hypothetical protein X798_01309 [Onchocerca flexuosa]